MGNNFTVNFYAYIKYVFDSIYSIFLSSYIFIKKEGRRKKEKEIGNNFTVNFYLYVQYI